MLNIPESIKDLYKADVGARKNFRVVFPNGEMPDITNENIVQESVKFNESICSQQYLKFGLTEAPTIEFETVGVANMYGMTIKCYNEIDTSSLTPEQIAEIQAMTDLDGELVLESDSDLDYGFYRVPLGVFRVDSCPRSHGQMAHRKVTAYSDYGYDAKIGMCKSARIGLEFEAANKALQTSQSIYDYLYGLYGINLPQYTERERSLEIEKVSYYNEEVIATADDGYQLVFFCGQFLTGTIHNMQRTVAENEITQEAQTLISSAAEAIASGERVYKYESGEVVTQASLIQNMVDYCHANKESLIALKSKGTSALLSTFVSGDNEILYFPNSIVNIEYMITLPFVVAEKHGNSHIIRKQINAFGRKVYYFPSYSTDPQAELYVKETVDHGTYQLYKNALRDDAIDIFNGALEMMAAFYDVRKGEIIRLSKNNVPVSPSLYSELWWDEYDVAPIGSVTYKINGYDGEEDYSYQFDEGLSVYDMTGNAFIELMNDKDAAYINAILDNNFVPNTQDIYFTPTECDMKGLPYLEAGDYLEIDSGDVDEDDEPLIVGTYIMRRTMSGIQSLKDTIESSGGEIISGGYYITEVDET